jgi:hypothetical protein
MAKQLIPPSRKLEPGGVVCAECGGSGVGHRGLVRRGPQRHRVRGVSPIQGGCGAGGDWGRSGRCAPWTVRVNVRCFIRADAGTKVDV